MKTTLDVVDIVWKHLDQSSLKVAITGKIYKNGRPINSKVEDVVINSLPINNELLQEGVVNVNIFVPNKDHLIGGYQDNTQADHARLKTLASQAAGILNEVFVTASDVGFDVQQQAMIEDKEAKEHYINIRLSYYCVN